MAINLLVPLLIPLGEQINNVTQLLGEETVKFEQDKYDLKLDENAPPGQILQLRARVLLQDESLKFFMKSKSEGAGSPFRLDPTSGALLLTRKLDYEQEKFYNLTIEARVGESVAEASVTVTVQDVNEFRPIFTRRTYETQITEEDDRHLPKPILKVSAIDQDGGRWGDIRYFLSGEGAAGAHSNAPSVSAGEAAASALERVEEGGIRANFASFKQLEDEKSDPKSSSGSRHSERDPFRGETQVGNRVLGIKSPEAYFYVNSVTGDVLLARPLDRDPPTGRSQWRLKMTATDGELEDISDVIINVKDVNDNAPFFPDHTVFAVVPENAPKGSFVTRVTAIDNDDPLEALNAKLVYSLDKNVMDQRTRSPIFEVDNSTGIIKTHVCCLDREETPSYSLQIVATDGGNLKGTGTVSIEVMDENDVGPRFSRDSWVLQVPEEGDVSAPIGSISIVDPDVTNEFIYRIVSGDESNLFEIKAKQDNSGADLYSRVKLDYENENHKSGFRFRVQVTDLGEMGWSDVNRTASSWVTILLLNTNDNQPRFLTQYKKILLPEDSSVPSNIASFSATDGDRGEESKIRYSLLPFSDKDELFTVNQGGNVTLRTPLDRERTPQHTLKILAVDGGLPPKTATATLEVVVSDVNDNPPRLSQNHLHHFQVLENSAPRVIGRVYLDDPDDWTLGHGPPFTMNLDPGSSRDLSGIINLTFTSGGVLRTLVSLDREVTKTIQVPIVVADGGSPKRTGTVTVTVTVADVNDNPMKSATKNVIVHAFQPLRLTVPLGRVYVDDPDDWDSLQKDYSWSHPHPLFTLNASSGEIFMKPEATPGRYELGFYVSDQTHGQDKVRSTVSVRVESLDNVEMKTTTPLLVHLDPYRLVHAEKDKPSHLDSILFTIRKWLDEALRSDGQFNDSPTSNVELIGIQKIDDNATTTTKCMLWIHTPHYAALQKLLLIQKVEQLENLIGAQVSEIGPSGCFEELSCQGQGCWSKIEFQDKFSLIDANETSVVGPQLRLISGCGCQPPDSTQENSTAVQSDPELAGAGGNGHGDSQGSPASPVIPKTDTLINSGQRLTGALPEGGNRQDCFYNTCLNGGKCLPTESGFRCVCPEGTFGKFCKILSRHFANSQIFPEKTTADRIDLPSTEAWAWLPPLPTCSNVHISLEIRTLQEDALLLYTASNFARKLSTNAYSDGGVNSFLSSSNFVLNDTSRFPVFSGNSSTGDIGDTLNNNNNTGRTLFFNTDYANYSANLSSENMKQIEKFKLKRSKKSAEILVNKLKMRKLKTNSASSLKAVKSNNINEMAKSRFERNLGNVETADMLILELQEGRPILFLNLGDGLVDISLNESYRINDNKWHRIDILWKKEYLHLLVDLCASPDPGIFSDDGNHLSSSAVPANRRDSSPALPANRSDASPALPANRSDAASPSRIASRDTFSPFRSNPFVSGRGSRSCGASTRLPGDARQLNIQEFPLQLGGISRSLEGTLPFPPGSLKPSLVGCVRNIRINRELQDVGHSLLSQGSYPGCKDLPCPNNDRKCGLYGRERCAEDGGDGCVCALGWEGPSCSQPSTPSTFLQQSFATLALSFTPSSFKTQLQLRFRSHGTDGQIIKLSSPHGQDSLTLRLVSGQLCLHFKTKSRSKDSDVCLVKMASNDGNWHDVLAQKLGSSLILEVDEGDGLKHNSSLLLDDGSAFSVSQQDGCHIGGSPEYVDGKVHTVHEDFSAGCVADVRLDGHPLPLPPAKNETQWGRVTASQNVQKNCDGTPLCKRFSCRSPLTCFDTWNSYYCGCGEGMKLSTNGKRCEDVNECHWSPCLNGGTCHNTVPGYYCECQSNFEGRECQMLVGKKISFQPSLWMFFCLSSVCLLFFLLVCVVVAVRRHHHTSKRNLDNASKVGGGSPTSSFIPPPPILEPPEIMMLEMSIHDNVCPFWHQTNKFHHPTLKLETGPDVNELGASSNRKRKNVSFLPEAAEVTSASSLDDIETSSSAFKRSNPPSSRQTIDILEPRPHRCPFPILKKLSD